MTSVDPIEVPLKPDRGGGGDDDLDKVPKLPRGKGLKLSTAQMIRIGATALMLVLLIVMQRPCANAVSGFVTGFGDGSADPSKKMPTPNNVVLPGPPGADNGSAGDYEHLGPNMTPEQIKAAVERSKVKAAAAARGSATGSGSN